MPGGLGKSSLDGVVEAAAPGFSVTDGTHVELLCELQAGARGVAASLPQCLLRCPQMPPRNLHPLRNRPGQLVPVELCKVSCHLCLIQDVVSPLSSLWAGGGCQLPDSFSHVLPRPCFLWGRRLACCPCGVMGPLSPEAKFLSEPSLLGEFLWLQHS